MMFRVEYFKTPAGRFPAKDFLDTLRPDFAAQVFHDIMLVADKGLRAPASVRPVKGAPYKGLFEIRTLAYRVIFCMKGGFLWILEVCHKNDETHGYWVANERRKRL